MDLYDEFDDPFDDGAVLRLIGRFASNLTRLPWFAHLGARLDPRLRGEAQAYLNALGFPYVGIAPVGSFTDAAEAARSPDFDDPAWEAEEQLRAGLANDAGARFGEEAINIALTHVAARAAPAIEQGIIAAGDLWDVRDEALLNAASGAAVQSAHQAALVLLAGAPEDHALALKFRLFERGRWPVGIAGSTFNLF